MRDHVRPTDGGFTDGIYRVVGTSDDEVTLLRVGDADGRRINTGIVATVSREELEAFEPAPNPDGNRPLGSVVASKLELIYWSPRAMGQQLIAHPIPAVVAGTLLLGGYVGERLVSLPPTVSSALIVVGALALVYIGSGRLKR